jgi:hypothetical protein
MKVKMKPLPPKSRAKKTGIVYCSYNDGDVIVARRYVYPKLTDSNSKFRSIQANLFKIEPSDGYKRDLQAYIRCHNSTPAGEELPLRAWNNLYLKLMYAMAKADPTIDLSTLTREDIYEKDLPCITLKRSVESGLLPKVWEWELLTNEI